MALARFLGILCRRRNVPNRSCRSRHMFARAPGIFSSCGCELSASAVLPSVGLRSGAALLWRATCPVSGSFSGSTCMHFMRPLDLRNSAAGTSPADRSNRACVAAFRRSQSLVPPALAALPLIFGACLVATAADATRAVCLLCWAWLSNMRQNTPVGTMPLHMAFDSMCCCGRLLKLVHSTSLCHVMPSPARGSRSGTGAAQSPAHHRAPCTQCCMSDTVSFFGRSPPLTSSALEQCEPTVSCQPGLASTCCTPGSCGNALLLGFLIVDLFAGQGSRQMRSFQCMALWCCMWTWASFITPMAHCGAGASMLPTRYCDSTDSVLPTL